MSPGRQLQHTDSVLDPHHLGPDVQEAASGTLFCLSYSNCTKLKRKGLYTIIGWTYLLFYHLNEDKYLLQWLHFLCWGSLKRVREVWVDPHLSWPAQIKGSYRPDNPPCKQKTTIISDYDEIAHGKDSGTTCRPLLTFYSHSFGLLCQTILVNIIVFTWVTSSPNASLGCATSLFDIFQDLIREANFSLPSLTTLMCLNCQSLSNQTGNNN